MGKTLSTRMPTNMAKLLQGLRWLLMPILLIALVQNLGPMPTDRNDPNHTAEAIRSVVVWRGGTGNLKWSDPANWAGGHVPGPSDFVRLSKGSMPDAVVDPAFGGVIAGLTIEDNYDGTVTLARNLTVHGEMTLSGGVFEQGANALTAHSYIQSGGDFKGGSASMTIEGLATVTAGVLTTPQGTLTVDSLTINAPGTIIMAANGKLNLTGSGTPLMGTGLLDTTTHRPNSVEYTGRATTETQVADYQNHPIATQGFSEHASLMLAGMESGPSSAVIDPVAGFAYFGTSIDPGIVVKVRLSDFTRVGALTLDAGEGPLRVAVIDSVAGFAYFGTATSPGKVVKVRLSDFTRVGALTFNAGEDNLSSAVIDPAAGFAYFGTGTATGKVVKVRLSDFTRTGVLTLNVGEGYLRSAVIDPTTGFAYFGTNVAPWVSPYGEHSTVVKVRLSDFARVDALTLNAGEVNLSSAIIDSAAGLAYFGTNTLPGKIVKVRLSHFDRLGALTLSDLDYSIQAAVIDPLAGFAYFGAEWWYQGNPAKVVKVRLSDFIFAGSMDLPRGDEASITAPVIDPAAGFAYFGTSAYGPPGHVAKIRLSDLTQVDLLTFSMGDGNIRSAVIDPAAGFAYFGTGNSPSVVVRVRLSDFTRVDALTLNAGEDNLASAVIDPVAGFAYFGTATSPGKVVKVRLSDFTRVGALTFNAGEDNLSSAVIDPAAGFAYFGTNTPPSKVVKVRLSDFTRVKSTDAGEGPLRVAVIDPTTGFAYFGTNTAPGKVVKVRLSDFTRADALTLNAGEGILEDYLSSAVIDPAGFAYFGTAWSTGTVVKIRLSDFARVDALTLNADEGPLTAAVIDPAAGLAYFCSGNYSVGKVTKVRLSDFARVDALTFHAGEVDPISAVIDPAAGFAYFGTDTGPGRVIKVNIALRTDLSISNTDGQATALPGDAITYTIKVVNLGPDIVTDTVVMDTFPAAFTDVNWQCITSAGSSCADSGLHSGDINTTVNLAVNDTATFLASGIVSSTLNAVLSNTATVTVPPGAIDSNSSNNWATDADWIGTTWPFSFYLPLIFK